MACAGADAGGDGIAGACKAEQDIVVIPKRWSRVYGRTRAIVVCVVSVKPLSTEAAARRGPG